MTRTRLLVAITLAAGLGASQAENISRTVLEGARDDVKAHHETALHACDPLSGNARDVCKAEAEGRQKVALAWLDYRHTGSDRDRQKLNEAVYEARHEVARERCDDLAGDRKDLCLREARTARDKAKADARLQKEVAEAMDDAQKARMKADYQLAAERCNSLAGERRDVCMTSAEARFRGRW